MSSSTLYSLLQTAYGHYRIGEIPANNCSQGRKVIQAKRNTPRRYCEFYKSVRRNSSGHGIGNRFD